MQERRARRTTSRTTRFGVIRVCLIAPFAVLAACGDDPMGMPSDLSGPPPTVSLTLSPASIQQSEGVSIVTATLDRPAKDWITVTVSAIPAPPAGASDFELSENRTLTFRPGEMSSSGVVAITGAVHRDDEPDRYVTVIALAESRGAAVTPGQPVTLALADIPDVCQGSSALDFHRGSFYRDDCDALLAARDELRGTAMLNWDTTLAMPEWEGVTLGTLGVEKVALPFFELDGTIPAELGELDNLKVLHLARNGLTGEIPPELGSMARLEKLLLWGNDLEGEIPPELGGLARLEELFLSSNELTGGLPPALGNLPRLKKFYVYNNELTGRIPPELGRMSSIEYLVLNYNQFSGAIPPELGNARSLRRLDLEHNQLTGAIPPELGRLRKLEYLDLENNQLTDSVPPELADASELRWVSLGVNQLTGSIPGELGSLQYLGTLNLGTNRLEGTIPTELGGYSWLSRFYVDNNPDLTGPIPMSFVENSMSYFYWYDTGLCSPSVPSFQAWLESIRDHRGGEVCGDGDFEAFNGLSIGNDGSITLQAAGITLSVGQTGCFHSSTLNGKLWDYHWSAWQRDSGSGWNDVSGTRTEGRLCGYDLTSAPDGRYRLVGDWTLAGVRGKYKSGNEVTVGSGSAIFGRVLIEDEGLAGVAVHLSNGASTTTSGGGNYRFDNVGAGTYTVTISGYPDDFSFDDTSKTVTISAGQSAEVNFHGIYLRTSGITGRVFVDGLGLGGVTVTLSGTDSRSITTGDDGRYAFTGLRAGSYRVTISGYDADAYEFEVTSQDVTLALDEDLIVNFEGRVRGDDYKVLSGLTITASGAIKWGNLTNTGCIGATRITISGSTYDVHWTEWQRKTASSPWSQVAGTRETRQICGYNLSNAAAGTYRFAGEFTPAGGSRAKYKSENEVTVGGGGGNQSPVTVGSIPSATVIAGESTSVNASSYFSDPDGDALTYTASSPRTSVATTSVSGRTVTVAGVAEGTATIRITATDPGGLSAEQSFTVTVAGGGGSSSDRAALVALYNATDGPKWIFKTNWLTDAPIGDWYGVDTDASGRVVQLNLRFAQLTGEIPPELGDLENLVSLNLRTNRLTGEIPPELGNLKRLRVLRLWQNRLTGSIPPELGNLASLEELDLHSNSLAGGIPLELGRLASLEDLDLSWNDFTGSIPSELGNLASLKWLGLSINDLTGEIPSELGNLASLRSLRLIGNDLTGEIPPELGNLARLESLSLTSNDLTGEVPPELGNLDALRRLGLERNELTGAIPDSFLELNNLDGFSFEDNDGLCAPSTDAFTSWLQGIPDWSGPRCEGGDDYKVLSGLTITNSGAVKWNNVTNAGCIGGGQVTISGTRYEVHWTEWQRKTGGSAWSQVSGTRKTRQICGYNLSNAAAGTYRFVGEFTPAGGSRAKYKSENEVTVGGGGGNQSPVTVGSIPSATVNAGENTSVNASSYFSDPDGDALTYTASSSRSSVATTSVSGRTVTVTGVAAGTATIRITATDPGGLSADQTFRVTVEAGGGGDDFEALTGFKVENDGGLTLQTGGVYLAAGNTGCITLSGTLNGRRWEYHETWWQRDTGSGWQDVSGTKKTGRLCGYNLTSAPSGKYRAVGDMTIAGVRGKYKSENEVTR